MDVSRCLLLLCLFGCGSHQTEPLRVSYVDAGLQAAFDGLCAELPDRLIVRSSEGIKIVEGEIASEALGVVGRWSPRNKQITIVDWLDSSQTKVVLAHELGHALGLGHSDHGLMTIEVNPECLDREAECLIEALDE